MNRDDCERNPAPMKIILVISLFSLSSAERVSSSKSGELINILLLLSSDNLLELKILINLESFFL